MQICGGGGKETLGLEPLAKPPPMIFSPFASPSPCVPSHDGGEGGEVEVCRKKNKN